MKCFVVSPIFPPEPIVSARTSADVAEELSKQNYDVTVITAFPNRPAGKLYPGFSRSFYQSSYANEGYRIIRCFSFFSLRSTIFSRFLENISFGLTSFLAICILPRPDVIYSNTWPVFASGLLMLAGKLGRIPVVLSIQDIYPESLISQGRIRPTGVVARILKRIDRIITMNARAVIIISNGFKRIYEKKRNIEPQHLHLIPNWIDEETLQGSLTADEFRKKKAVPDESFLAVYAGNISVASGIEGFMLSFAKLSSGLGHYLLVAGEGSRLAACRDLAAQLGGGRILIHSPWLVEETGAVLRAADLLILSTLAEQSLVSVPSKLVSYMLAGRPVLAIVNPESDVAQILKEAKAGWSIFPEDTDGIARRMTAITQMSKSELNRIGQNGFDYAIKHMIRRVCAPKAADLIARTALTTEN